MEESRTRMTVPTVSPSSEAIIKLRRTNGIYPFKNHTLFQGLIPVHSELGSEQATEVLSSHAVTRSL